jgi:hypothetical protein
MSQKTEIQLQLLYRTGSRLTVPTGGQKEVNQYLGLPASITRLIILLVSGYVNKTVYTQKIRHSIDVRERITTSVAAISPDMLRRA